MGLESIHDPGKRASTVPRRRGGKYSVSDIDASLHVTDNDGDTAMMDMDDEDQIESLSAYLSLQRSTRGPEPIFTDAIPDDDDNVEINFNKEPTSKRTVFVVDTNFMISHLNTLEHLRHLSKSYNHTIVIPNVVIQELDGLKTSDRNTQVSVGSTEHCTQTVGQLARNANSWIYKHLANMDSGLVGQKLRQVMNPSCTKDDAILDCCVYFKDILHSFTILLSNDKNLCLKALTEGVLTVSYRKKISAELIATRAYHENLARFPPEQQQQQNDTPPQKLVPDNQVYLAQHKSISFVDAAHYIFESVQQSIKEAMDFVIRYEYDDELELIDYNYENLKNLQSCCKCIYNFWLSVFSEYLSKSKVRKNDWRALPQHLTRIPQTSGELELFIQFWEDILSCLFLKRTQGDREALHLKFSQWDNLYRKI